MKTTKTKIPSNTFKVKNAVTGDAKIFNNIAYGQHDIDKLNAEIKRLTDCCNVMQLELCPENTVLKDYVAHIQADTIKEMRDYLFSYDDDAFIEITGYLKSNNLEGKGNE